MTVDVTSFRPNLGESRQERALFQAMLYHARKNRLFRLGVLQPPPPTPMLLDTWWLPDTTVAIDFYERRYALGGIDTPADDFLDIGPARELVGKADLLEQLGPRGTFEIVAGMDPDLWPDTLNPTLLRLDPVLDLSVFEGDLTLRIIGPEGLETAVLLNGAAMSGHTGLRVCFSYSPAGVSAIASAASAPGVGIRGALFENLGGPLAKIQSFSLGGAGHEGLRWGEPIYSLNYWPEVRTDDDLRFSVDF